MTRNYIGSGTCYPAVTRNRHLSGCGSAVEDPCDKVFVCESERVWRLSSKAGIQRWLGEPESSPGDKSAYAEGCPRPFLVEYDANAKLADHGTYSYSRGSDMCSRRLQGSLSEKRREVLGI